MTRSHTSQGKGSQALNKLNGEPLIHSVQNPNEGMIYLIPLRKGCPQMSRHIGLSVCTESKRGNGSVESDPMLPPPSAYRAGYFPQFFLLFFGKRNSDNLFCAECQSEFAQMLSCCMGVRIKTRLETLSLWFSPYLFSLNFLRLGVLHD
jgi:hypothetical protein